jgi:hypothetical protein
MALTPTKLKTFFPEFKDAGDPMLQAHIDASAVDETIFGAQADYAHACLVGMRLADTPWGRNARLQDKDGKGSTYERRFREVSRTFNAGARLV